MPSAYCGECGWKYRADTDGRDGLNRAMIEHFVETGHSPVERCDAATRPSTDGRLEPAEEGTHMHDF